ncbi:MAG: hypothetical protein HQ483_14630 [Rhodospirillales bacterium]|nr:hypothetical protein [Rhodospirillales bacterium]
MAANRNEVERRVENNKLVLERYDADQHRKQISDAAVARQTRAIEQRRNDTEDDFESARQRTEQTRYSDTVSNDRAFQNRQAEIAGELVNQRANRAAVYAVTLSEFDESLALDQLPQDAGSGSITNAAAQQDAFRSFMADRDSRNAERALTERDRTIRQQIDLRTADSNLRSIPEGAELPRGALVDVFG